MKYIQTYNEYYLNESFLSDIKDKIKNITNKEKLKEYLASLFYNSEKMNRRLKKLFISSIIGLVLTSMISKQDILDIIGGFSTDTQNIIIEEIEKDNL